MEISGLLAAVALGATLLNVDGNDAGMQGLRMSLDDKSAGVVGDTVTLTTGKHRLAVDLPSGLQVTYELLAGEKTVDVRVLPGTVCSGNTSWSFVGTGPTIDNLSDNEKRLKLTDPEPVYQGVCLVDLPNLSCRDRSTRVRIDSLPENGAQVWIDNVPLKHRTPMELSVRFCAGTASRINVVLHKAAYAPCEARVDLESGADRHQLTCKLSAR